MPLIAAAVSKEMELCHDTYGLALTGQSLKVASQKGVVAEQLAKTECFQGFCPAQSKKK
jgi:hypothetical protein